MTLGENIRKYREEKQMSQAALGDEVGVRQQTIHNYERGFKKPSIDVLMRMVDTLGCTVDDLIGKSDRKDTA